MCVDLRVGVGVGVLMTALVTVYGCVMLCVDVFDVRSCVGMCVDVLVVLLVLMC
jgi:hypothetical protein